MSSRPADVAELTRLEPGAFAAFAGAHRAWVENLLLAECAHQSLVGWPYSGPPLVVRWAAWSAPAVATALPVPASVAVGLARAHQQREGIRSRHEMVTSRLLDGLDSHVDQQLAQLWHDLALLAGERDPVAAAGLRKRVENRARPALWARSLEWLLLLGIQLEGLDVALTARSPTSTSRSGKRSAAVAGAKSSVSSYVPPGCRPQSSQRGRWKSGCSTSSPRRSTPAGATFPDRWVLRRPPGLPTSGWKASFGAPPAARLPSSPVPWVTSVPLRKSI